MGGPVQVIDGRTDEVLTTYEEPSFTWLLVLSVPVLALALSLWLRRRESTSGVGQDRGAMKVLTIGALITAVYFSDFSYLLFWSAVVAVPVLAIVVGLRLHRQQSTLSPDRNAGLMIALTATTVALSIAALLVALYIADLFFGFMFVAGHPGVFCGGGAAGVRRLAARPVPRTMGPPAMIIFLLQPLRVIENLSYAVRAQTPMATSDAFVSLGWVPTLLAAATPLAGGTVAWRRERSTR